MKRLATLILSIALLLTCIALADPVDTYVPCATAGFTYDVPERWVHVDGGDFQYYYGGNEGKIEGGYLVIYSTSAGLSDTNDFVLATYYQSLVKSMGATNTDPHFLLFGDTLALKAGCDLALSEESSPSYFFSVVYAGTAFNIIYTDPLRSPDENKAIFDHITASVSYESDALSISSLSVDSNSPAMYSYDELLDLRKKIDAALWASDGWQNVAVPSGMYLVGDDIPAGRWTVTAAGSGMVTVYKSIDEDGKGDGIVQYTPYMSAGDTANIDLYEGQYVKIEQLSTYFTPYVGAALGFK